MPSIGSTTQVMPDVPGRKASSSPRIASSGRSSASRLRRSDSDARSIAVTTSWSLDLVAATVTSLRAPVADERTGLAGQRLGDLHERADLVGRVGVHPPILSARGQRTVPRHGPGAFSWNCRALTRSTNTAITTTTLVTVVSTPCHHRMAVTVDPSSAGIA